MRLGNAGHLNFNRYGDLAFDLFRGTPWPLSDDLDVVVGDVRIGLDRKSLE